MTTIKTLLKYTLLALILISQGGCFSSCPDPDYTDQMEEILDPVDHTLEDFYTKHQRFPNTQERNKILEDRGCMFGESEDVCEKYGILFDVRVGSTFNPPSDYKLYLTHKKAYCLANINSRGKKQGKGGIAGCSTYCGGWQQ